MNATTLFSSFDPASLFTIEELRGFYSACFTDCLQLKLSLSSDDVQELVNAKFETVDSVGTLHADKCVRWAKAVYLVRCELLKAQQDEYRAQPRLKASWEE
jgi:hypothetical protein